ncbi:YezD family protein [Anatilimnocola sp. NA78]|uniref:YezD family protein n=1 Tax=Anatilimnocola sp. NA78 TaxID=3415683 RepID=UPI003CE53EF9
MTTQPALRRFSAPYRAQTRPNQAEDPALDEQLLQALADVKFGSVSIIVQDGVIVQLERIEKFRPSRPSKRHD